VLEIKEEKIVIVAIKIINENMLDSSILCNGLFLIC